MVHLKPPGEDPVQYPFSGFPSHSSRAYWGRLRAAADQGPAVLRRGASLVVEHRLAMNGTSIPEFLVCVRTGPVLKPARATTPSNLAPSWRCPRSAFDCLRLN